MTSTISCDCPSVVLRETYQRTSEALNHGKPNYGHGTARHVLTPVIGSLVGGVLVAGTPAPAPQTLKAILGIEVTGFTKNPSMEGPFSPIINQPLLGATVRAQVYVEWMQYVGPSDAEYLRLFKTTKYPSR